MQASFSGFFLRRNASVQSAFSIAYVPLLLICLFVSSPVFAHDPGLSSVSLQIKTAKVEIELGFSLSDAEQIMNSLKIGQTALAKNDMVGAAVELQKFASQSVEFTVAGQAVPPTSVRCQFEPEARNANIFLEFKADTASILVLRSKWLGFLPPGHRQFLSIRRADGVVIDERLLSAYFDEVTIQPETTVQTAPARKNSFADFLLMGIKHIWTGYDHLLFLFGLLIVTYNYSSSIKIITCFTIAHSITLALATLNLVHIPSRVVEPLIAVSIVYVGIENLLREGDPKGRWLLTFAFGLIHGFGFASVLRELGVGSNGTSIVVPLVSFNLGVELGQIMVAALLLPLIWKLRMRPVFVRRWVPAGSMLVALLGSYWFIQRVWT